MKSLFCVFCFCAFSVQGQTLELQQLQVNIEKLAQLKLMLAQMKQGFQVLQQGYNSVSDAAKGNFNQHRQYLDGLLEVSQPVKHSVHIQQSVANHEMANEELKNAYQLCERSGLFRQAELLAFRHEWNGLSEWANNNRKVMELVVANGALRMNDAERIALLVKVERSSAGLLVEARKLISEHQKILSMRGQYKKDIEALKRLSGIK